MNTVIVISCILASGAHHEPRGIYRDFGQCQRQAEQIEDKLRSPGDSKQPLCWCHKVPRPPKAKPASKLLPQPAIHYSDDRKAPL